MTANPTASVDVVRNGDTRSSSPIERRTTSSTFSNSRRGFGVASSETGESSAAGSQRNSLADGFLDGPGKDDTLQITPARESKGTHRSHRSRNSGGFLLSHSFEAPSHETTEPTPRQHPSPQEKGKKVERTHKKRGNKRRSDTGLGLGLGNSPLGATVVTAGKEDGGDHTTEDVKGEYSNGTKETNEPKPKATLDVDSQQIVNLALNLSESRRNAARRITSSPLPPVASFLDAGAGGSLRQHLQQQRRSSRNLSPRAERNLRASTTSPRTVSGQQLQSPLHATFEYQPEENYQYHFTASTLARAEKARNAIGLMAEYRRLLQYVPPLKPSVLARTSTANSTSESPLVALLSPSKTSEPPTEQLPLGRPYNPLQYIRNRKVRARERKTIDGEEMGFGDLEKVSSWVDQIEKESQSKEYQSADCVMMPTFSKAASLAATPLTSPQPKSATATPKMKRPRIDWVTNPADMIADIFWLEQDDNKKIVEDRAGRKIYPVTTELKRPVSHREEEPYLKEEPGLQHQKSPDLRIDTRLPEFKSLKGEDKHYDSAASRAKHKLRQAAHLHHGHNGSIHDRQFLTPKSKSDSESSDTDGVRHLRRKRSGTADTHDNGKDILEKQMLEMLAKEARENEWSIPRESIEAQVAPKDFAIGSGLSSAVQSRTGSIVAREARSKRNSIIQTPSGRASLEVPGGNPRFSLDDLDSTAPNSPTTAARVAGFVPTIGMDLSPPPRHISPSRSPLSKVKSKINPFHEHSRTRSRGRGDETPISAPILSSKEATPESPVTPEGRKRSMSPVKKIASKKTDEKGKSSIRKGKSSEDSSGIRGLFKGTRGPVARVSDFLWKKEASPILSTSSGFSTDDSDLEGVSAAQVKSEESSRDSSAGLEDDALVAGKQSYLGELPTFNPATERRGRQPQIETTPSTNDREAREERRRTSRASLLEAPPRIDIQNASPSSSPDFHARRRFSSVSEDESRRGSIPNSVASADARLNAILGIPGRRRSDLPVTGLYSLETTHRRPSLDGKRQWSISDRDVSSQRGPMTKREIARVRALLLSSGIKAKEISRRGGATENLSDTAYSDIASMAREELRPVSKAKEHILAANVLSKDIQLSTSLWQSSADTFIHTTIPQLQERINALHRTIADDLTPLARRAADEADEVSKDLVTSQTLQVKHIIDMMDKMMRRRRRRLRWVRRGGWVLVEWVLVGVMWMVWFLVTFARIVWGVGRLVTGSVRWLLWL
jgi:hypothetical protein